jgi:hypothetical protein
MGKKNDIPLKFLESFFQLQTSAVCHPHEGGDPGKRWAKELFVGIKNKNLSRHYFCRNRKKFFVSNDY